MPFKSCPACGKQVRTIDPNCWNCHHVFDQAAFATKFGRKPQTASEAAIGVGCIVLLGVVVVGAFNLIPSCSSAGTDKTQNRAQDPFFVAVAAEDNLKAELKDPGSADFRGRFVSRVTDEGLALCGEVNSKNSFGGYTGFRRFVAGPFKGQPVAIENENADQKEFSKIWEAICSRPVQSL